MLKRVVGNSFEYLWKRSNSKSIMEMSVDRGVREALTLNILYDLSLDTYEP